MKITASIKKVHEEVYFETYYTSDIDQLTCYRNTGGADNQEFKVDFDD